jgi:hypothetical protein
MSKEMGVIALGIFVAVVPYLGLPGSWKTTLFVVTGFLLALLGFLLRGEVLSNSSQSGRKPTARNTESHPFVESQEVES